jgi:hypothetical protein
MIVHSMVIEITQMGDSLVVSAESSCIILLDSLVSIQKWTLFVFFRESTLRQWGRIHA